MEEGLLKISQQEETVVVRYLLDIMKAHGIITEEEYGVVLYQYD